MTPAQFRAARERLGLSVNQMAALLEVRPVHVRKMELAEDLPSHRRIMPVTGGSWKRFSTDGDHETGRSRKRAHGHPRGF